MRADFALFDTYEHEDAPPSPALARRVVGFHAADDRRVTAAMVEGWGRFAAPGGFEARAAVPGHHLFVCGRARRARARAIFSRKQSRDRRRLSRSPGNILGI